MRVLAAPGAFKESIGAVAAARAIAGGVAASVPSATVDVCPLADGGDGTLDAVVFQGGARVVRVGVTGPLGAPLDAELAMLADGTAVVESARACGLAQLPSSRRDPMRATTRGVGELLLAAIDAGATRVVIGLGGSATTDGGTGALAALGFAFANARGEPVPAVGGAGLASVERIVAPSHRPWTGVSIVLASDVTNPLLGPDGAARTYGPQKGASAEDVDALEAGLERWARCLRAAFELDVAATPGAGAAGGLAGGLAAALGARLVSGADWVMDAVGFDARVRGVDLVITGEGALDGTSARGKLVSRVIARAGGAKVVALAGELRPGWQELLERGLTAGFALAPGPASVADAIRTAAVDLGRVAAQVVRVALPFPRRDPQP